MAKMRLRRFIGWSVIILISIMPIFLWAFFGDYATSFNSYKETTHNLGELFGLVGMTTFSLTFILSTRIKWIEDVFGGLDKVYIAHGILGGTSLILLLFHPILLVLKFVPSEANKAIQYLLPSSYWSVNFGIFALLGMIFLVYLTLYTKIKYHKWKFTHEFFGLVFIMAVLHIFLVRGNISQDNIFNGYYWYASIVSIIGFYGFSYSLFLKNRLYKNAVYKVSKMEKQKNVISISLTPEHKPISYKSGQFVYLRFYNERLSKEPHPFSIASKSNDEEMRIVIKKLGDFTSMLDELKVGDKVSLEGPYGRFIFRHYPSKDQVWIAAGIGITPFLNGFDDLDDVSYRGKVDLYHSVKEEGDFVDYRRLSVSSGSRYKFIPWNTSSKGYLTAEIINNLSGPLKDKEFFICGPDGFKEAIIKGLKKFKVSESKIHEEAFNFR